MIASLVTGGTILAFLGLVYYIIRSGVKAEIEKAALESSKTADDAKIESLNQEYLKHEAQKRNQESNDAEAFDDDMERSTTPYYPGVSDPNRDPDGYN